MLLNTDQLLDLIGLNPFGVAVYIWHTNPDKKNIDLITRSDFVGPLGFVLISFYCTYGRCWDRSRRFELLCETEMVH